MLKKLEIGLIITSTLCCAAPPFTGTIFMDPDIITSTSPSSLQSTTYTGQGVVNMYDRRVNAFINVNAYLFDVVWNDGITSVAQINDEFGSLEEASIQAKKYALLIGQLPAALRIDIDMIWVHKGLQPFGGGNRSILIHTDQTSIYESEGILEETLLHEATHTSLDAVHSSSTQWVAAQERDNEYISTYAKDNPTREDLAESFLPWLAVRYCRISISSVDYNKIIQSIPNRLLYLDSLELNLHPLQGSSTSVTSNKPITTPPRIRLFDIAGRYIKYKYTHQAIDK